VVIVVPHTSWHDFYMGLLVRRLWGADIKYVAKKELFKPPFGWYFRWMGGTALDRTPGQKKVEAIAKIFREKEEFRLAIAPEGTRKKVTDWKTGFYYIAKSANVPVVMVAFDYGRKTVKISEPLYTSENKEEDFKKIKEFYSGVKGKVAHYT
jgi:1-acyl-sn-glycerol-3-phosphate acyltransferase